MTLAVSADKPIRDITEYADKTLRRQLESVNGVGQVVVVGRPRAPDQHHARLRRGCGRYNLTVTDVSRALQTQNAEIPGGRVEQGATAMTLRTRGRVRSVAGIRRHRRAPARRPPGPAARRRDDRRRHGRRRRRISGQKLAEARPEMIGMLNTFRDDIEDLGSGLGVTDPVSGEVVFRLPASKPVRKKNPAGKKAAKRKKRV